MLNDMTKDELLAYIDMKDAQIERLTDKLEDIEAELIRLKEGQNLIEENPFSEKAFAKLSERVKNLERSAERHRDWQLEQSEYR